MLEHLELKPGMKVLEIGAGTGYNAALMSEIVGKKGAVFSIDIQADVADQTRELLDRCGYSSVRMACRDGAQGWESEAPFDRIVATVGCPDISWAWSEQLDSKGFMLIPLAHSYVGHPLVKLASGADVLKGSISGWSGFMEIHGELASPVPPWRDRMEKLLAAPSTLHPWPVGSTDKKEMRDLALFLAMLGLPTVMEDAPITVNPSADSVVRVAPEGLRLHGKDNEWLKKTSAGVERWVSSGRPKRADYKIRLMPPAMASVKLRIGALIFRRKNSLQITEW
jgi:protein-L-isoaspartate(D-aspartate) O-methyltransferase